MQGAPQIQLLESEAGSPLTLPAGTQIDVKSSNSEEVHLENASLYLSKIVEMLIIEGAGHPTAPENGLSSRGSWATDSSQFTLSTPSPPIFYHLS